MGRKIPAVPADTVNPISALCDQHQKDNDRDSHITSSPGRGKVRSSDVIAKDFVAKRAKTTEPFSS